MPKQKRPPYGSCVGVERKVAEHRVFASGEDTRALRLTSELVELRVELTNPAPTARVVRILYSPGRTKRGAVAFRHNQIKNNRSIVIKTVFLLFFYVNLRN